MRLEPRICDPIDKKTQCMRTGLQLGYGIKTYGVTDLFATETHRFTRNKASFG